MSWIGNHRDRSASKRGLQRRSKSKRQKRAVTEEDTDCSVQRECLKCEKESSRTGPTEQIERSDVNSGSGGTTGYEISVQEAEKKVLSSS